MIKCHVPTALLKHKQPHEESYLDKPDAWPTTPMGPVCLAPPPAPPAWPAPTPSPSFSFLLFPHFLPPLPSLSLFLPLTIPPFNN